jgi:hypothetical protein
MELYTKLTSTINDVFTTQLGGSVAWQEVPGQLSKVSSSPGGYTWGLNAQNYIFVCKEPCTGAWSQSAQPGTGKVLDITTDSSRVFALVEQGGKRVVYSADVASKGSWGSPVDAPADSNTLVATTKDIFMDTDRGVFKCKSPCTLPGWTAIMSEHATLTGNLGTFQMTGDKAGNLQGNPKETLLSAIFRPESGVVKTTSASARFAYGVSADNKAHLYQNGQWHLIAGLAQYMISSVSGEIDDTAIYATTTNGVVLRCGAPCASSGDVTKIGTPGMTPNSDELKQISVNPQSKQVWMLSSTLISGSGGSGIYNRKDEVPVDVNSTILPLDQSRKNVLIDIDSGYGRAEAAVTVGDALEKTHKKIHEARPRMLPEEDPRILRRKIDFMDAKKPILLLQIACATVFIILLIILMLPHPFSTMLSFVAGCFGAMLVVSFSTS